MYIKRNIKKKDPNIKPASSKPRKLICTMNHLFDFPYEDNIPPEIYYSCIYDACFDTDRSGREVLDVFYILKPNRECYKSAKNLTSEPPKEYYIKQRYIVDSEPFKKFVRAMTVALNLDYDVEFDVDDIIGVTERVCLVYFKTDGIGGFDQRAPWTWEDYCNYE